MVFDVKSMCKARLDVKGKPMADAVAGTPIISMLPACSDQGTTLREGFELTTGGF